MKVAITGSSGLIGTAVTRRLEHDGHEVTPVRRGPASDPNATWDPAAGWFRDGALDGFDGVVHLAGASIGEGRWNDARKKELRSSRIDGTRLLVGHLAGLERRPGVLVSASAIGYYGDRGDESLTEQSPPGTGFLADLVRDWEAEALKAKDAGIRTVLPRMGVVLSKRGGALPRMLTPFRLGLGGRLGSGKQWMSWVSLDDAVGILVHALTGSLDGPVNAVSPNPVTNREFTAILAKVLHRPAIFPAPGFALKVLIGESAEELLLSGQRVIPERLQAAGYSFVRPELAAALTAELAG